MRPHRSHGGSRELRPGEIFARAEAAGLTLIGAGTKRQLRCPFHDDDRPSAFVSARNIFYCSVCTPNGGWSLKSFVSHLRTASTSSTSLIRRDAPKLIRAPCGHADRPADSFTPEVAHTVWRAALSRALRPSIAPADAPVWNYLERRGLAPAVRRGLAGVLGDDEQLPSDIRSWPRRGYRLLAPLFNLDGKLANVQARAIVDLTPKILFPRGSIGRGVVFGNEAGQQLLRGDLDSAQVVVLGEGLTDFLALSQVCNVPVLTCPGTQSTRSCIGPWVRGRILLVALDCDPPGEGAAREATASAYRAGSKEVRRLRWRDGCKDACAAIALHGLLPLEHLIEAPKS